MKIRKRLESNGILIPNMRPNSTLEELVFNVVTSRAQLMQSMLDPKRDYDTALGYPTTAELGQNGGPGTTVSKYRHLYDRDAIAARVVEIWPDECWTEQPTVYEDEDTDSETEFELAWDELCKGLNDAELYQDEKGSIIWDIMKRADILSGIGHFGGILIGIDDGKDLSEPADGIDEKKGKIVGNASAQRKLLYLKPFDESLCQITQWEADTKSPRYGKPLQYNITFVDPNDTAAHQGIGATTNTLTVHWTRVVHICDSRMASDTIGVPRLRPVYNRVFDLYKLYGPSAEMFWLGAFPGLSIETHPQLGGDVEIPADAMKTQMFNYQNQLQRYLALAGMTAKSLAPSVADPKSQIEAQIQAICIKLNVPQRVFMGSERGELSSGQDAKLWNGRVNGRRVTNLTPREIAPVVARLIALRCLPRPKGFSCAWPEETLAPQDRVNIANTAAMALSAYVGGGVNTMIPSRDWLVHFHGMDEEVVDAILEQAVEDIQDEEMDGEGGDADPLKIEAVKAKEEAAEQAQMQADAMAEGGLMAADEKFAMADQQHANAMELEEKKASLRPVANFSLVEMKDGTVIPVLLDDDGVTVNAWSPEAIQASIEARRAKAGPDVKHPRARAMARARQDRMFARRANQHDRKQARKEGKPVPSRAFRAKGKEEPKEKETESKYGKRNDGTEKGSGYFGELKMKDGSGDVATEISVGVEIDGEEREIPSLVPGLTKSEKDYLLKGGDPRKNKSIMQKAVDHAKKRIADGKSPFASEKESK